VTGLASEVAGGGVAVATPERRELMARVGLRLATSTLAANFVGAAIVFLLFGFLLPASQRSLRANIVALVAYLAFTGIIGSIWSTKAFTPVMRWVLSGDDADARTRTYLVRQPLRQAGINFALWMGSEVVFLPINARYGVRADVDIGVTILLGAITTCGLGYLLVERILRPLYEIAFTEGVPRDPYVPGVKSRLLLTWGIGTGIPLVGVVLMALRHANGPVSGSGVAFLGCVGLLSGAVAMVFSARSIADPVESVTAALADVEAGRLDLSVRVYDASQVGQLQAGFNAMVDGLRERRRLRDLFGRQVGEDVAEHALERGVRLGGEQVHAAVLFVDVIGSTRMAALNQFFAIVVDVVDRTGGIVNKFEGDAALCIFGAPVPRDDASACALRAARLLRDRLEDVNGLSAGIGVSAGNVVAGNVGTKERFEYTVIGDPVNEAARLTDLAKARPERVLVSAALLDDVPDEERAHWVPAGRELLRGRTAPTELAVAR
jgi:adenylate cyclase